ncbi:MAG: hypothetical protein M3O61_17730, partial [Gemmatimonadota bacterium]|nr:hypothetical protein [Gemmatimonadota bacterium]
MIQSNPGSTSLGGERACTLTAGDIAGIIGGELRGDPATMVSGVAPIDRANPDDVTFLSAGRYSPLLRETRAGVVLATAELADSPSNAPSLIVVAKPHEALLALLPKFYPEPDRTPAIHASARVGHGARIGSAVSLDAYAIIGRGVQLGDGVWIGAHAVIGDGVRIGARSRIYPN